MHEWLSKSVAFPYSWHEGKRDLMLLKLHKGIVACKSQAVLRCENGDEKFQKQFLWRRSGDGFNLLKDIHTHRLESVLKSWIAACGWVRGGMCLNTNAEWFCRCSFLSPLPDWSIAKYHWFCYYTHQRTHAGCNFSQKHHLFECVRASFFSWTCTTKMICETLRYLT